VIVGSMDVNETTSNGTKGVTEPFAATETSSGAWGPAAALPGSPVSDGGMLQGLSCVPGGDCTIAVTVAGASGAPYVYTAVSGADGSIGSVQQVYQAPGANIVYGLSCPQDGHCTMALQLNNNYMLGTEATASTVDLTASAPKVTYGAEQSETLTATVSSVAGGTPTGTVTVTGPTGSTPCTITLANGTGTCTLTARQLPAGTDMLTAGYSGDATYVPASGTTILTVVPPSSSYVPAGPARILDTRHGTGGYSAPVRGGQAIGLQVTGKDGVPASGVTAVVLNVTAVSPTASSHVTVYPDGKARPVTSNLNFTSGQTIPNLVIVPVGADGKVDLYNYAGSVNLLADLAGYYLN
jgi:hypothetical protein